MSLSPYITNPGDLGGMSGATALCRAMTRLFSTPNTTWIPFLETSPPSLRDKIPNDNYPYRDAQAPANVIATDFFGANGISHAITSASTLDHWTGLGNFGNCGLWDSTDGNGGKGTNTVGSAFLTSGVASCANPRPVLCFEVPLTQNLSPPVRMFFTSTKYNGNLGGLNGADNKCTAQASSSNATASIRNSGGRWFAVMSDVRVDAITRVEAAVHSSVIHLLGLDTPGTTAHLLFRVAWTPVFASNRLYSYQETGMLVANSLVWTGSTPRGVAREYKHCSSWTATSGDGQAGNTGIPLSVMNQTTRPCNQYYSLYCMQYFSPFVRVSARMEVTARRIVVTALIYDDIDWYKLRCLFTTNGYGTNASAFWDEPLTSSPTYAMVEIGRDKSPEDLYAVGLVPNRTIYVTCAMRTNMTYSALSWLVEVGNFTFPNPPDISNVAEFNNAITISVQTNGDDLMRMRCIASEIPPTTAFLWSQPLSRTLVEIVAIGTGASNLITFTGLIPNKDYCISCAQMLNGPDVNLTLSTSMTTITLTTLPVCADPGSSCPMHSACVDSTDGSLFECSPFIDGGLRFSHDVFTGCGVDTRHLLLTKTSGNESISFCLNISTVRNVSNLTGLLSFYYDTDSSPSRFECTDVNVTDSSIVDLAIVSCLTSPGMGGNLTFALNYRGKQSVGGESVSYPIPIIIDSTLRLADFGNSTGSSSVTVPVFGEQVVVAFDVQNVELLPELKVNYGYASFPLAFTCRVESYSNMTLYCLTDPATQYAPSGFYFTINANKQPAAGRDTLHFLSGAPEITSLNSSACNMSQVDAGLTDCPTVGHTSQKPAIITVVGENFNFTSSFRIFIAGEVCTLSSSGPGWAACRLPPGSGFNQSVSVQHSGLFSAPRGLLSYAPPMVQRVCGCDVACSLNTTEVVGCARGGSQILQIFGVNFGRAGATVFVGSSRCLLVTHNEESPHSRLSCTLPPGSGLQRTVLVIQASGTVSSPSATVSYAQCHAGTFQNRDETMCLNCSAGTYSSNEGVFSCTNCDIGTFSPILGATVCVPCNTGMYQNSTGQSTCEKCPPGTINPDTGRASCDACPPGSFSNAPGSTVCNICEPGTRQPAANQTACSFCSSGTFQRLSGQSVCDLCLQGSFAAFYRQQSCELCKMGTYQAALGGSRCDSCDSGRFAKSEGASECVFCQPGYIAPSSEANTCVPCPAGSSQSSAGQSSCSECGLGTFALLEGSSSCDICEPGSITPFLGAKECLKCPGESTPAESVCACDPTYEWTGQTCQRCSLGQDCNRVGVLAGNPIALPGYVQAGNGSYTFRPCLVPIYCPGGRTRCAPFRRGPLCQLCVPGYREENGASDGSCSLCPSKITSTANIAAVGIALVVVLVVLYYFLVRAGLESLVPPKKSRRQPWWELILMSPDRDPGAPLVEGSNELPITANLKNEDRVEKTYSYQLKIVITFCQLATSITDLRTFPLPPSFRSFLSIFEFVNLNFIPWNYVGCISKFSLFIKIIITAIVPFGLFIVAGSIFFIVLRYLDRVDFVDSNSRRINRAKYRAVFWKVALFTLFLAYPAVSRQIFSYFRCVDAMDENGEILQRLQESFEEVCGPGMWLSNVPVICLLIFLYPVGVPVAIGFVLRHYHHRFKEPHIRYSLGFAFEGFVGAMWYFEVLDMLHKLFVVSIVALLPAEDQALVAMLVLGLYLSLLTYTQPYVRKADNQLHMTSQLVLYLMILSLRAREGSVSPSEMGVASISAGSSEDILLSALFIALFASVLAHSGIRTIQFCRLVWLKRRRGQRKAEPSSDQNGSFSSGSSSDLPTSRTGMDSSSESTVLFT